jgi:hypothetical protein
MTDTLLSAAGAIISYLFGIFVTPKLFQPGLDEAFAAWKVLFAFLAAASVFISQDNRGLVAAFGLGVIASILLGINYKSANAFPPFWSSTDISWFSFQVAQSCILGIIVRFAAKLKDLVPKKD